MSNDNVSAIQRLFNECNKKTNPDLNKIDEYINECRCNNENMNTLFAHWTPYSAQKTPLHVACYFGHHEAVERLLDSRNNFKSSVDVNAMSVGYLKKTALHYACIKNNPLTVRKLLQHPNIAVNVVDEYEKTSLNRACYENHKAIVIELLKHPDIQLPLKDSEGCMPLHNACLNKNTDIIEMLLDHNQQQNHRIEQLNAKDNRHQTALHIACNKNDHVAVVEILKHAIVININATGPNGETPLYIVCSTYYINILTVRIVKALLKQSSINIYKKNNDDKTPFDIIKQHLDDPSFNEYQKQYLNEILQMFEEYRIEQRWFKYCYFMNNYYYLNSEESIYKY